MKDGLDEAMRMAREMLDGLDEKRRLRMLLVMPGLEPKEATVEDSVEALQRLVGGTFQIIYPWDDSACLICNDEGKLNGMPPNRMVRTGLMPVDGIRRSFLAAADIIHGPFLVSGFSGDDLDSLTDLQMEGYRKMFSLR